MEIEEKIVLITGGANGIGFAYAKDFLRNGAAHVAILDLPNSNGEQAADKLNEEFGEGRAIFIVCDVSKPKEMEDAFNETVNTFGGLDIVVNNAGILDESNWELMIDVNMKALLRGTFLGLQYMGKNHGGKGGTIVNTASIAGITIFNACPVYTATKHAVVGLSRSFGTPYYFEKFGVRILTLCPGLTDTRLITESFGKFSTLADRQMIVDSLKGLPSQKKESVSEAMISIVKSAENGTVWSAEDGEPACQIFIPDHRDMKAPPKKF